jgi:hypothetical protein
MRLVEELLGSAADIVDFVDDVVRRKMRCGVVGNGRP